MSKKEKTDVENFVRKVTNGDNVKAQTILEKILKDKTAKRINDVLKN